MSYRSRADLLRCLEAAEGMDEEMFCELLAFDYQPNDAADERQQLETESTKKAPADSASHEVQLPVARRINRYWYVKRCQKIENDDGETIAADDDQAAVGFEPITPRELPEKPLRSTGDWQNCWDQVLPMRRSSRALDVRKVVRHLSRNRPVQRLPVKYRQQCNHPTVLMLDRSETLRPVWDDLERARQSLLALLGGELLTTVNLPCGPAGYWYRFGADAKGKVMPLSVKLSQLPLGSVAVIISDFGVIASADNDQAENFDQISPAWRRLLRRLITRGHTLVLLPLAGRLATPPAASYPVDARPSRQVETLLTALSQAWLPDERRLRYLRLAVNGSLLDELRVYNHQSVVHDGPWISLPPVELQRRLQQYNSESFDGALRQNIQTTIDSWHYSLGRIAREAERLQRHLHGEVNEADYPVLLSLARQTWERGHDPGNSSMAHLQIRSMLSLTEVIADQQGERGFSRVLEQAQAVAKANGQPLPLKQKGLKQTSECQWLHQLGDSLVLSNQPTSNALLALSEQPFHQQTRNVLASRIEPASTSVDIIDRQLHWQLAAISKPRWADRIWCDGEQLFAAHERGAIFELIPADQQREKAQWECRYQPWEWAAQVGVDDYGLWADLRIGSVPGFYRMRWIPPGRFMMGSPESESDREKDEQLHEVGLTQGYWLGETTVNRKLWAGMTKKSGSEIEDSHLPQAEVSWNDCQKWMASVNQQLDGLIITFPSEAQWEYACRAGTRNAYWWGDVFDPGKANNSGKLVDESTMPPNPWGLRSMSGNLWEWGADWHGQYPAGPVSDPTGPRGRYRVLRGGGWLSIGRDLRSARRNACEPGYRDVGYGLRLAGGFDPQASKQGASGMTADRWPPEAQRSSGRATGGPERKE
ncbi:MAG: hypothetical protein Tsb002_38060 [Wenzhouxiangellaceae bacterium]